MNSLVNFSLGLFKSYFLKLGASGSTRNCMYAVYEPVSPKVKATREKA